MNKLSNLQKYISLLLKAVVVISACTGTLISYLAGRDSFMGGRAVFMGTAWWILLLLIVLIAVGYGYLALADIIRKKREGLLCQSQGRN